MSEIPTPDTGCDRNFTGIEVSRRVRRVQYLWGGGFWEESYYVGTAGDVSTEAIEQYIERAEHV